MLLYVIIPFITLGAVTEITIMPIYLAKSVGRSFSLRPTGDVRYPGDLSGNPTIIGTGCFYRTGHPRSG